MKRDVRHYPVLVGPILEIVNPRPGQVIVDCTVGLGGHSAAILERIAPGGRLIGMDFDGGNIELAQKRLETVNRGGGAFELHQGNFAGVERTIADSGAGVGKVDAILADLGVASPQIDDPERGFSYRADGPLDMRMDRARGQPASALIARMSAKEMAEAFLELGDESDAVKIAELIVARRKEKPIVTTSDLAAIVCEARDFTLQRAAGAKLHPAARTFQALRILVNRELANLDRLLAVIPAVLKPGGAAAIISFHSGEDRRVKAAFKEGLRAGVYSEIGDEPVLADEAEQKGNPAVAVGEIAVGEDGAGFRKLAWK